MSSKWPMVPLGEVMTHRKQFIEIDDHETYKRCRVQLHVQGVVLRDVVAGTDVRTKRQQVCRAGEFLVAEIDAKMGGFGIVPDALDGAIVSSHYFLFAIDETKLVRRFLALSIRTRGFRDQVAAQGSTNYAAVRPSQVLSYTMLLPPLSEQRRIVARIEKLAAKIEEARELRRQTDNDIERLAAQMAHRTDLAEAGRLQQGWRRAKLGDVLMQVEDVHPVVPEVSYPNLGIYSYGRGLFWKQPISGASTSAKVLNRVHANQFIYSRLFAFEGAYGLVLPEYEGYFVSNEYPTFECRRNLVRPEFLSAYFRSPGVWSAVAVGSKGLGHRRQRLQPEQLLEYTIWLPPLTVQEQMCRVLARVQEALRHGRDAAAAMEAVPLATLERVIAGASELA